MKKLLLSFTLLLLILLPVTAFAHSGKTDSSGGHYNRSTGEYHYHHGYSAHDHTNGVCPYDSAYSSEQHDNIEKETGINWEEKRKKAKKLSEEQYEKIKAAAQSKNENRKSELKKHPIIGICITVCLVFLLSIFFCNMISKTLDSKDKYMDDKK